MKILVTGAFGNLGSHTVQALLAQDRKVRCLDLDNPNTRRVAARFGDRIEVAWGDIRDAAHVRRALEGIDVVVHLAAVIPPLSNEKPDLARDVNVKGTKTLVDACQRMEKPPRLILASTFDLFGRTMKKEPPRTVNDPIQVSDVYTETKAANEKLVHGCKLDWLILRFTDMPVIGMREAHPIMYEIPLDQRIEALHPADAGLAIANAIKARSLWGNKGRTLLIGGGPSCQLTYGEYLGKILEATGVGRLPAEAFTSNEYVTDWVDTVESQRLLQYQRHSFDDIVAQIAGILGLRKYFVPLARPFARASMLRLSPYYKKK